MALEIITGYTDDGTVFLKFEGQQQEDGRPVQTVVTIEPDMAMDVSKKLKGAAKKAFTLNKRQLIVGQPQTFKKVR